MMIMVLVLEAKIMDWVFEQAKAVLLVQIVL
jgi:hypothetical protein